MRFCVSRCHSGGLWAALATALLLAGTRPVQAQQLTHDPVESLRQVLKTAPLDPARNPQEVADRRAAISARLAQLRGVGDMRRALLLHEWLDEDQDPQVASVDRTARNDLVRRLYDALKAMLDRGSPTARLAAATMLSEVGVSIRGMTTEAGPDTRGFARTLAPELARDTAEGTPAVRVAAARALGSINPDPAVATPALARMIDDEDPALRRAAAGALARMVREVTQLIPSRGKNVSGIQATPAEVVKTGAAIVPLAAHGVNDRDAGVRRASIDAILQAATAMTDLLPGSRDIQVGSEERVDVEPVAQALGEAAPAVGRALDDPDPSVRVAACRGLEDIANARLRLARRRGETTLPAPAKDTGAGPRGDAAPPGAFYLASVQQPGQTDTDRLRRALGRTLPDVSQAVSDPDVRVRLAALEYLEMLGPDAAPAAPAVIKALSDRNLFVRWAAARTLGKMGPVDVEDSVPALAKLLFDPDLDVRLVASTVLEHYGSAARAAVPALSRASGTGDAEARIAALRALDAVGPAAEAAVPAVTRALRHPDVRVRRTAAEVLGRFGPAARSAEPALRRTLSDDDADVRRAASDALLNILSEGGDELGRPRPAGEGR